MIIGIDMDVIKNNLTDALDKVSTKDVGSFLKGMDAFFSIVGNVAKELEKYKYGR